ncbi:MAG: HAD-IB family hydrolase [Pseudomonadales bacterium]
MAINRMVQDHVSSVAQVEPQGQVIAYFDLDRTLILGYSALALAIECVRSRVPGMRKVAKELLANREKRASGGDYTAAYEKLVGAMTGISESAMQAAGERAFSRNLASSVYREAQQIVQAHKAMGHHVAIITAASSYQVDPIARSLGIEDVYCSRLTTEDGLLTGKLDDGLCYGEGKVKAAKVVAQRLDARLQDAWFYSDSEDDLPLLEAVGHPVATNPSSILAAYARDKDWAELNFCSRGKPNLQSVLRSALVANAVVTTAAAGAASWLFSRSPEKATNRMTSWLGDVGSVFAGLEFEIEGAEHLEEIRPAIFTFNHQSYLDTVVMAHLVRHDMVAFCKSEVADNRFLGPLLKAHGTIFIDRDAADQSLCMEQAKQALVGGKSLVIAPEGTRSATGELLDFKPGAFYLAKKMGVPIVPVVLHNVADALPKGRLLLRPATIQVTVLPPIFPAQIKNLRRSSKQLHTDYSDTLQTAWCSEEYQLANPVLPLLEAS